MPQTKMWAQVLAVKSKKGEDGKQVLVEVGLKGISRKEFSRTMVYFAGLKFITTSYYHDVSLYCTHARITGFSCSLASTKDPKRAIHV